MEADWFDLMLLQTEKITRGDWKMSLDFQELPVISAHYDEGDEHGCETICGCEGFYGCGEHNIPNALLATHAPKMRDEIIRLRKLLRASEIINTHSSLDEK